MSISQIDGMVATGFEKVADAFAANFRDRGDTGAACCVYADGTPVVDVWAGEANGRPWTRETRSVLFSVSKGVTTVCLLMAVERGHLDLDALVVDYWPEFGAHGKDKLTVRQMLAHRAGLIAPQADLTVDDLAAWYPIVDALAAQEPLWHPGAGYGYHAVTFGFLAGELLRRVTGKRPNEWLAAYVNEPLDLTMRFGWDPDDPDFAALESMLPVTDIEAARALAATLSDPVLQRAMTLGVFTDRDFFATANSRAFLSLELAGANLVTSAHELARFYAATIGSIDGTCLLRPETVRDARIVQSEGAAAIGDTAGNRWATGFMINSPAREMAGPGSFGHDGAGGHLAFAHLELGIAFCYQTIRPGGIPDDRAEALCRALRACL